MFDPAGILSPINSPEHAWMEGFADYFASVVDSSLPASRVGGNLGADALLDTPRAIPESTLPCAAIRAAFNSDSIELDVAATLFDAFDITNEPGDALGGSDRQVFQIFDRELDTGVKPTISDFRDAWLARGLPASALGRVFILNGIGFRRNYPAIARAGADVDGRRGHDGHPQRVGLRGSGGLRARLCVDADGRTDGDALQHQPLDDDIHGSDASAPQARR